MRLALIALALAACGPKKSPPPAGGDPVPSGDDEPTADDPASDPPDPGPGGDAQVYVDEHNRYRADHCAPPLAWSEKLAKVAQDWADELRDSGCAFDHSRNPYGENLAMGSSGAFPPEAVVEMWYREVDDYDFRGGGFSMDTGHFTQLVWKETTHVGCGTSTCNGMDIVVCNYDPFGNVEGGYRDNVLPTSCH